MAVDWHSLPDALLTLISQFTSYKVILVRGQLCMSPTYITAFKAYQELNHWLDYQQNQKASWAMWHHRNDADGGALHCTALQNRVLSEQGIIALQNRTHRMRLYLLV